MGIALLSLSDLFGPLQSLAHRWVPRRPARRGGLDAGLRYVFVRPSCAPRHASAPAGASSGSARPLRVIQRVEGRRGPGVGRLVISGRMADVCAELDRLADLEAAQQGMRGIAR